jgi:hypothetical protein
LGATPCFGSWSCLAAHAFTPAIDAAELGPSRVGEESQLRSRTPPLQRRKQPALPPPTCTT